MQTLFLGTYPCFQITIKFFVPVPIIVEALIARFLFKLNLIESKLLYSAFLSGTRALLGEDGESWAAGEVGQSHYLANRSEKNISIWYIPARN